MNIKYYFSIKRKLQYETEVMNVRSSNSLSSGGETFKIIVYLTAIINYHIWKVRNNCVFQNETFNYENVVNKLIRSIGARRNLQQRLTLAQEALRIPRIDELFSSMIAIKNITFLHDNG